MSQNLTPEQERIFLQRASDGKPLTGIFTASVGISLQADLHIIFERHKEKFGNNFSNLIRDMVRCYKANGIHWENNQGDKLDRLIGLVENLRVVEAKLDVSDYEKEEAKRKVINASEGFSVE